MNGIPWWYIQIYNSFCYALYEYLIYQKVINKNHTYTKQYTIGILSKKNEQMFYKYGIPIVHLRNIKEYKLYKKGQLWKNIGKTNSW